MNVECGAKRDDVACAVHTRKEQWYVIGTQKTLSSVWLLMLVWDSSLHTLNGLLHGMLYEKDDVDERYYDIQ